MCLYLLGEELLFSCRNICGNNDKRNSSRSDGVLINGNSLLCVGSKGSQNILLVVKIVVLAN